MSNVTLPDPIKVAFMRRVAALPITDDMVERALIARWNYHALHMTGRGRAKYLRGSERECIRQMLEAALGGAEDGDI